MKITGDATLNAPVDKVWDALLDPRSWSARSRAASGSRPPARTPTR